jgi:hypothetical protein
LAFDHFVEDGKSSTMLIMEHLTTAPHICDRRADHAAKDASSCRRRTINACRFNSSAYSVGRSSDGKKAENEVDLLVMAQTPTLNAEWRFFSKVARG